jgi:hypothetical protein
MATAWGRAYDLAGELRGSIDFAMQLEGTLQHVTDLTLAFRENFDRAMLPTLEAREAIRGALSPDLFMVDNNRPALLQSIGATPWAEGSAQGWPAATPPRQVDAVPTPPPVEAVVPRVPLGRRRNEVARLKRRVARLEARLRIWETDWYLGQLDGSHPENETSKGSS